jgi:hypothetical protein
MDHDISLQPLCAANIPASEYSSLRPGSAFASVPDRCEFDTTQHELVLWRAMRRAMDRYDARRARGDGRRDLPWTSISPRENKTDGEIS